MKAYELLNSPYAWCQETPAEAAQGNKVYALDPRAVRWCALGAIEKVYPPARWEEAMDSVLRSLGVSEGGLLDSGSPTKLVASWSGTMISGLYFETFAMF
jgi:hypothetical protein